MYEAPPRAREDDPDDDLDHEPPDLAEITRVARAAARTAGNNFVAARDLAETGVATPNG